MSCYEDVRKINRENALERISGREHRRVGEPVRPRQKPPDQKILEAFRKKRRLSYNELVQTLPSYAYCMLGLIAIEMGSGHIREVEKNVYEITERGMQSLKYGFGKKFLPLNE